jgi:hypothetical protein
LSRYLDGTDAVAVELLLEAEMTATSPKASLKTSVRNSSRGKK